jgi:hypothetical protein
MHWQCWRPWAAVAGGTAFLDSKDSNLRSQGFDDRQKAGSKSVEGFSKDWAIPEIM